jgi:hypothetical protein
MNEIIFRQSFRKDQVLVFFLVAVVSLFSINIADGLIYSLIFISHISKKQYVYFSTLFFSSLFLDICSFSPIGITFFSITVFYAFLFKFRAIFVKVKMNAVYLLASLCCGQSLLFVLTSVIGYNFQTSYHLIQIIFAMLFYILYYVRTLVQQENSCA